MFQSAFNTFAFQPLKIFLVVYFWKMALSFLNNFFNEKRKSIIYRVHAVMIYTIVVFSNELIYLVYWEILVNYRGTGYSEGFLNTESMVIGYSKQVMYIV